MDCGVWGLALTALLFLVPSFILLNVGFRCYLAMLNSRTEIIDSTQCSKLDKELALAVVVCGFVFLALGFVLSVFTVIVHVHSRRQVPSQDQTIEYI